MQTRRTFLKHSIGAGLALGAGGTLLAQVSQASSDARLTFSAPLTHSDWILKPGIEWGDAGVRHMLDACKACGYSIVHWRTFDAGRATYKSKLLRPMGKGETDSYWTPQTDEDKKLFERFTAGVSPQKRKEIEQKLNALDYANFEGRLGPGKASA